MHDVTSVRSWCSHLSARTRLRTDAELLQRAAPLAIASLSIARLNLGDCQVRCRSSRSSVGTARSREPAGLRGLAMYRSSARGSLETRQEPRVRPNALPHLEPPMARAAARAARCRTQRASCRTRPATRSTSLAFRGVEHTLGRCRPNRQCQHLASCARASYNVLSAMSWTSEQSQPLCWPGLTRGGMK